MSELVKPQSETDAAITAEEVNAIVKPVDASCRTPMMRIRALAQRALAVAATRTDGTWTAYCDAVPGQCHANEWKLVLAQGDYIPEEIARAMFPEFVSLPYAR